MGLSKFYRRCAELFRVSLTKKATGGLHNKPKENEMQTGGERRVKNAVKPVTKEAAQGVMYCINTVV